MIWWIFGIVSVLFFGWLYFLTWAVGEILEMVKILANRKGTR